MLEDVVVALELGAAELDAGVELDAACELDAALLDGTSELGVTASELVASELTVGSLEVAGVLLLFPPQAINHVPAACYISTLCS